MQQRKTIVVEGFQSQFVLTLLVWAVALGVVFVRLVVGPRAWSMAVGEGDRAAAHALLVLHDRLWLPMVAFYGGLALLTCRVTHRVAGPLYRFRQAFGEVGRGNLDVMVRIRKRDFLHQESAALEAMLHALSSQVERARRSVTAIDRELTALSVQTATDSQLEKVRAHTQEAGEALARFIPRRAPRSPGPPGAVPAHDAGFSIIELLLVASILGLLVSMTAPVYAEALNRARVAAAIGDLNTIGKDISMYQLKSGCFPASLADVNHATTSDPWGRPYHYAVPRPPGGGRKGGGRGGTEGSCGACGGGCVGIGAARKDKNLVPINGDFDLFSAGRDGRSLPPITAQPSRDDVVRGRNGGFIGLASEY